MAFQVGWPKRVWLPEFLLDMSVIIIPFYLPEKRRELGCSVVMLL